MEEKLKELWDLAAQQVKEEYEEEWGEGSWEERADKYEREDIFLVSSDSNNCFGRDFSISCCRSCDLHCEEEKGRCCS